MVSFNELHVMFILFCLADSFVYILVEKVDSVFSVGGAGCSVLLAVASLFSFASVVSSLLFVLLSVFSFVDVLVAL